MTAIQFITTVTVPDDIIDENGAIIGSEEWSAEAHREEHGTAWGNEPREPVAHFAARMLVSYASSSMAAVTSTTIHRAEEARYETV